MYLHTGINFAPSKNVCEIITENIFDEEISILVPEC